MRGDQRLLDKGEWLVRAAVLLAGMLACSGCGDGGPEVVPVTGVVTRGGKPVPNLFLSFEPDSGRPSWGITDAKGEFALEYTREEKGAKVGKHRVWVRYEPPRPKDPAEEMEMLKAGATGPPAALQEIEAKYGKAGSGRLEVEVNAAQPHVEIKLD